jgi:hypothetical protein
MRIDGGYGDRSLDNRTPPVANTIAPTPATRATVHTCDLTPYQRRDGSLIEMCENSIFGAGRSRDVANAAETAVICIVREFGTVPVRPS